MMRSINLAMTNCLDYKYKNIYIYGKYIFVLRENVSKNEMVSILIEMTGEWGFFFCFPFSSNCFFLMK